LEKLNNITTAPDMGVPGVKHASLGDEKEE